MGGDTTTATGRVAPDSALAIINDLLALNFFEQPARFGSEHRQLAFNGNDGLGYLVTDFADTDHVRVELNIGSRKHEVVLVYPASGAPEALLGWVRRTRSLLDLGRD